MKNGIKWFLLAGLLVVGGDALAGGPDVYVLKSDTLEVVVDQAFSDDQEQGAGKIHEPLARAL